MHLLPAASWLLHPLNGRGYQLFSGIGSSISEWLTLLVAIGVYIYHHNCHSHRCLRIAYHVGKDGRPVCKRHDPEHPSEGVIRNILKRLGLRSRTAGPVRFHYRRLRPAASKPSADARRAQ